MRAEVRKTAQGTEYWDNKEKRIVFVPAGQEPDFEVSTEHKSRVMGVGLANDKDFTSIQGTQVALTDMTIKQLKEYAADHNIAIPEEVKKKDEIIEILTNVE